MKKKITTDQHYEDYWKFTLEYTDLNGKNFINTLKVIVDFIDKHCSEIYSGEKYKNLQEEVYILSPKKDMGSVRKSINQFVKLGFVNSELKSYHKSTKDFLEAKTDTERESVFSKILYTNSSFNRSITKDSKQKEVNFLIRTLEENKKLHKEDIVALMTKDISKISKGYLSEEELKEAKYNAEKSGFIKRKYNQVGYLWNILSKLDDLDIVDNYLYFKEDAPAILVDDSRIQKGIRDAYLHRIYKNQLQEESYKKLGDVKCMLEKLSYPSLVASHIVPFISASSDDKYNSNNGLLLSRNMDLLFDQGYISFKESGIIILSDRITTELKVHLNKYSLDSMFINDKRKTYMNYHRNNVFK